MEQSQYQKEMNPKAPVFVVVISWLMLLYGIGSALFSLPLLLVSGGNGIIFWIACLSFVRGVGFIVISSGLRHMRRWALYTFTVLTLLGIIASVIKPMVSMSDVADVAIQMLVLIYFWAISKRFT